MSDQDIVQDFIEQLKHVLQTVVDARGLLFPRRMRDALERAWVDLHAGPYRIEDISVQIRRLSNDELASVGLGGVQLKLKYGEFFAAYKSYVIKGGLKRLKSVLGYANVMLPSITAIIPVSEPLKELKELVEKSLEDIDS